ncbi:MAG TPA: hypothetical protein VFV38_24100 [Ktedonobacteraceae bacterium]|nr:hypothetical protein [Ktedonobacteraceae bacterium]
MPFRLLQWDHFPSLPARERSTGLLNPSGDAGTSQQALSPTTSVADAAGRLGSAMQLHHDARGNRALP